MWRQSGDHPLQQSWPRLQKAASLYLPGWQWHCVCKVTHMQTHTYKRTEHSFNQSGYTHHIVHQNSPCCSLCISIMTLQLMHLVTLAQKVKPHSSLFVISKNTPKPKCILRLGPAFHIISMWMGNQMQRALDNSSTWIHSIHLLLLLLSIYKKTCFLLT